jgi:hypothetical protein
LWRRGVTARCGLLLSLLLLYYFNLPLIFVLQDEATGLDSVGRDLALLAACNHTIVSQGQFGNWAAFLAGGDMFTRYGVLVKDIMS